MKQSKLVLRMNILGGMHADVMENISDEDLQDLWLTLGVPDEATEIDLESIAEDDNDFADICKLYARIVRADAEED